MVTVRSRASLLIRAVATLLALVTAWAPATLLLLLSLLLVQRRCDESCTAGTPPMDSGIWTGQFIGLALPAWLAATTMAVLIARGLTRAAAWSWGAALAFALAWWLIMARGPLLAVITAPYVDIPVAIVLLGGAAALWLGSRAPRRPAAAPATDPAHGSRSR